MELGSLKKEYQEKLDKLFSELESKVKEVKTYESGKWYHGTCSDGAEFIVKYNGKIEMDKFYHTEFSPLCDDWGSSKYENRLDFSSLELIDRPATPEEVQSMLIKEAERRGYKQGMSFIYPWYTGKEVCTPLFDGRTYYYPYDDRLEYFGVAVYKQGRWAEIVKDSPIKIGGYEVKFYSKFGHTTIDGHTFTKEFWQAAKIVAEHSKAKIKIGCSHQFDLTLEVINSILDKLK